MMKQLANSKFKTEGTTSDGQNSKVMRTANDEQRITKRSPKSQPNKPWSGGQNLSQAGRQTCKLGVPHAPSD